MASLLKLAWMELKLFAREPVTVFFTFALPIIFLFVMGEVFGNTPDPDGEVYRGVGPMDYYVSAYVGLVMTAMGVISLPVHLAAYREHGVLRRLRASSVSAWMIFGSQVMVSLVIVVLSSIILWAFATGFYDVGLPKSGGQVIAAFILSMLSFAAVGVLLGAVLPSPRAAQGAGLLLFFIMLLLAGAGPPREVMTDVMRWVGDVTPLRHVIGLLQDPWLGFGWNWAATGVVLGFTVGAALLSLKFFRWE